MKWSEVEGREEYQSLSPTEKINFRGLFFDEYLAKNDQFTGLDETQQSFVRKGWMDEGTRQEQQESLDSRGDFNRGLRRGVNQAGGLLMGAAGLAGDAIGADNLRDASFEAYQSQMKKAELNPASVQRVEDIEGFGDAVDWLQGLVGEQVPMLATMAFGGGVGGALGKKALEGAAKKAVERQVARGISQEVAEKKVFEKIASLSSKAGVAASSGTIEAGGMWGQDAEKRGVENANAGSAAAFGAISGLSESVSPTGRLASMFGGGNVGRAAAGSLLKRVGIEIPKGMAQEGTQEVFQEFMGKLNEKVNDPTVSLADQGAISQYLNSFAAGAAIGGLAGPITEGFKSPAKQAESNAVKALEGARGLLDKVETLDVKGTAESLVEEQKGLLDSLGEADWQQQENDALAYLLARNTTVRQNEQIQNDISPIQPDRSQDIQQEVPSVEAQGKEKDSADAEVETINKDTGEITTPEGITGKSAIDYVEAKNAGFTDEQAVAHAERMRGAAKQKIDGITKLVDSSIATLSEETDQKVLESRKQSFLDALKGHPELEPHKERVLAAFTEREQQLNKKEAKPTTPQEAIKVEQKTTETPKQTAVEQENTPNKAEVDAKEGKIHDYSNTQIKLKGEPAQKIIKLGASISESELYTEKDDPSYGRETEPHVTVRYGLETDNPKDIVELSSLPPITAKMGKVSIFETDNYDVVKVDIEGDSLRAANKKVGDLVPLPGETHKDYQPHATIAYVKKGEGKKYIGDSSLEGKEIVVDEIELSGKDGSTSIIKLEGKAKPPKPQKIRPKLANKSTSGQENTPNSTKTGLKEGVDASLANPKQDTAPNQPKAAKVDAETGKNSDIGSFDPMGILLGSDEAIASLNKYIANERGKSVEEMKAENLSIATKDLAKAKKKYGKLSSLLKKQISGLKKENTESEETIKDWESREYKKSKGTYEGKDMYGQYAGKRSFSGANERRRSGVIRANQRSIKDNNEMIAEREDKLAHPEKKITEAQETYDSAKEHSKVDNTPPKGTSNSVKVSTIKEASTFVDKILEGDVTLEEYKSGYESLKENKDAILTELGTFTIKKLQRITGNRGSGYKKASYVKLAYEEFAQGFVLSSSFSYQPFSESIDEAIQRYVDSATTEKLKEYAEDVAKRREKRKEWVAETKAAIENPKTLSDFRTFLTYRKESSMTDEQKARYEQVQAEARIKTKASIAKQKATVTAVAGDVSYELAETHHAKKDIPLFVVKLTGERVSKERFGELRKKAKQLGGWYSRFSRNGAIPGFQFEDKDSRSDFVKVLSGETVENTERLEERETVKKKSRSKRLRATAKKIKTRGEEKLNQERQANTARRASMAAHAEAEAQKEIQTAETMLNLADAIDSGEVKFLNGIAAKTHIELLNTHARMARNSAIRKEAKEKDRGYSWEQKQKYRKPTAEDIKHAEYPYPLMWKDDLRSAAEYLKEQKGGKLLAKKLLHTSMTLGDRGAKNGRYFIKDFEFAQKLDKKLGKKSPWNLKDRLVDVRRLRRIGLETEAEFRAALREFVEYREGHKAEDPIKAAERSLVGRKIEGYFPTPKRIVERMVDEADLERGQRVLEPSAGKGSIAERLTKEVDKKDITTIEPVSDLRTILKGKGFTVTDRDFLEHEGEYDRIVMNPPFEKRQDVEHVKHAYKLLAPGGRIVAIMSEGPFLGSDKKATEFREWLSRVGWSEKLPEGSFKESDRSTGVNTRLVVIDKDATKFSTTPLPPTKTANTKTELIKRLGNRVYRKWVDSGRLEIISAGKAEKVLSAHGVKSSKKNKRVEGFTVVEGGRPKVYLIDGHIRRGQAYQTLLHEIGHSVLAEKYKGEKWDGFVSTFKEYAKRDTATGMAIRAAMARVPKDTPKHLIAEEQIAYYLSERANHKQGLFRRIIAHFKKLLVDLGFSAKMFTPEDLTVIAKSALHRAYNPNKANKVERIAADALNYDSDDIDGLGVPMYQKGDVTRYSVAKEYDKDILNTIGSFHEVVSEKADTSMAERILSTAEYIFKKSGAAKRVLEAQINRRDERFKLEEKILDDFVPWMQAFKKEDNAAYTATNNYLRESDRDGKSFNINRESGFKVEDPDGKHIGFASTKKQAHEMSRDDRDERSKNWTIKDYYISEKKEEYFEVLDPKNKVVATETDEKVAIEKMKTKESDMLREDGESAAVIAGVRKFRDMTNRAFDEMIADMRRVLDEAREAGLDEPTVETVDESRRWAVVQGKEVLGEFETEDAAKTSVRELSKFKGKYASLKIKKQADGAIRKEVGISEAIAMMGDLRGSYFPRQRDSGNVILRATHPNGKKILEKFDLYLTDKKYIDPETGEEVKRPQSRAIRAMLNKATGFIPLANVLEKRKNQLVKQGFDVVVQKDESVPESVFDAAQLMSSVDAVLNTAIDKAKKDGKEGSMQEINKILTANIADIFKTRGYLSSRKQRTEDYWEGFEEDMLLAGTQYARGLASGFAKKDAARKMVLAATGRDIAFNAWKERKGNEEGTWGEYMDFVGKRRLDPGKQEHLHAEVMSYMREVLRNQEQTDRIMGTMAGLAVLKFLAFRVSSAAVNMTNMFQAVPATISSHTTGSLTSAMLSVKNAAVVYGKYRMGKAISKADRKIFETITANGWDDPQFNQENAAVLRSKMGNHWDKFLSSGMYLFSAVEKVNRATTIFAAYKEFKKNTSLSDKEALQKAKDASDRAHGNYDKGNRPMWTRGSANPMKMFYLFQKFSHNYMLNAWEMGFKGDYKQAAFMLLSPAVLAGSGASIITPMASALLGMGSDDDPEEKLYDWASETFGSDTLFRHGLAGLAGFNLKGSLQIHNPMPTTIEEALGAPAGMVMDMKKSFGHIKKGEALKAIESALPLGFGNMAKALREGSEGITTGGYSPVFYGDEALKATGMEQALRFLSFNPTRISGIREKQWSEKKIARKFQQRRNVINTKAKRYYLNGTISNKWPELRKEIYSFNEAVKGTGRKDISEMTMKKIKALLRRTGRPNKTERLRNR